MQQEAAERVREMQKRARRFVEDEQADRTEGPPPDCPPQTPLAPRHKPSPLAHFGQDKEQLFLLMLAILLVRNDAPIELVLALLYLSM